MKHKQKLFAALLSLTILSALTAPALAAAVTKSILVETDVQVYVNDVGLDAGDTHGNPDAFIYNGTTYIAAAAVSKSLGQDVKWEGSTRSVYIGKHAGIESYLLKVCPPYQKEYMETPATISMSGMKYANGFYFQYGGSALFNLNGKYDTLSFVVGHMDGKSMYMPDEDEEPLQYNIYLDGELVFSLDLNPEMMPQEYTVPLNGALQMKVEGNFWDDSFALVDVRVF